MGIYKRPVMDWAAEVEREDRLMKEMKANGEFDNLTDDEGDCNYEMTLEEARDIVFGFVGTYRKDAKFTEEELIKEGTHPVIIEELMMHKRMYLEAVELLQKAGEM